MQSNRSKRDLRNYRAGPRVPVHRCTQPGKPAGGTTAPCVVTKLQHHWSNRHRVGQCTTGVRDERKLIRKERQGWQRGQLASTWGSRWDVAPLRRDGGRLGERCGSEAEERPVGVTLWWDHPVRVRTWKKASLNNLKKFWPWFFKGTLTSLTSAGKPTWWEASGQEDL